MRRINQDLNLNSPDVQQRIQSNIELFKEIIAWCASHHITLVNVISPVYHKSTSTTEVLNRFKAVAPILDYSDFGNDHPGWFNDDLHLNEMGANAFSNQLSSELTKLKYP
jgi:hypothetical protein